VDIMSAVVPTSLLRHNERNRRSIRFLFCLTSSIIATTSIFEVHRRLRSTASLLLPLRDHDDDGGSWTAPPPTTLGDDAVVEDEGEAKEEEMRDDLLLAEILRGRVPFPTGVDRVRYRPGSGLRMNSTEALRYCRVDPEHRRSHFGRGAIGGSKTFVTASERHKLMYRNVPKSASR
jgi:hypothetical protein